MNTVEEYIHKLNSKSHILSKEEFKKIQHSNIIVLS